MAALVQSKTYASSSASATHTLTFDDTPAQGNLIVACIGSDATVNAASLPSGWAIARAQADYEAVTILYKTAGASESKSHAFTLTSSAVAVIRGLEYSGAATASQVDVADGFDNSGAGAYITEWDVTTTGAAIVVEAVTWVYNGWAVTASGWTNSFTEDYEGHDSSAVSHMAVATRLVSGAGTYGTSASLTGDYNHASLAIVAFKQAAAAPPSGSGSCALTLGAAVVGAMLAYGASVAALVIGLSGGGATIQSGAGECALAPGASGEGSCAALGYGSPAIAFGASGVGAISASGAGDATVTLGGNGDGAHVASGDSQSAISVDADGSGNVVAYGYGGPSLTIEPSGVGTTSVSGSGYATLQLATEGEGSTADVAEGYSEAALALEVSGAGNVVSEGSGASSVVLVAEGDGASTRAGAGAVSLPLVATGYGECATTCGYGDAHITLRIVGVGISQNGRQIALSASCATTFTFNAASATLIQLNGNDATDITLVATLPTVQLAASCDTQFTLMARWI